LVRRVAKGRIRDHALRGQAWSFRIRESRPRAKSTKPKTPICDFKSDHGYADDVLKILTLTDHVRVSGREQKGVLECDKLVYYGNQKFFKATGHVRVLGTMNTVGTLEEVWATPDLKKIATPDMFNQPMKGALLTTTLL